jgi:hypothetical protein
MVMEPLIYIYFSGLIWDEEFGGFLEPNQITSSTLSQTCSICISQAAKRKSESPTLSLGSISYLGVTYHELDFIYISNEQDEDAPYKIAQILSFAQDDAAIQVQIRQLKHYDDLFKQKLTSSHSANWRKDEVLLVFMLYSMLT